MYGKYRAWNKPVRRPGRLNSQTEMSTSALLARGTGALLLFVVSGYLSILAFGTQVGTPMFVGLTILGVISFIAIVFAAFQRH